MSMSHAERVRRLTTMLNQVAGEGGLEAIQPPAPPVPEGGSLEAFAPAPGANALEKLKRGEMISPEEAFGLEAIVLPDKRPVVFVRNDVYDRVPMSDWEHLNTPAAHATLDPWMKSIGRIELPLTPSIPYGGTGFLVGPNLMMTNRHVARLFADGVGRQVSYHSGGSAVDFKREIDSYPEDTAFRMNVLDVKMIHPFWDMALLEVDRIPPGANILNLSTRSPEEYVGKDVVVVGYPARDYRNDFAVQDHIFQGKYGVKRLQPGKAQVRKRIESFANVVNAMTHDCSTLGGNSGSAVIDVSTGEVIGLHFAGEYLKANYCVPTYELARDSRVVDARVNFQGQVASTDEWGSTWANVESTPGRVSPGSNVAAPTSPPLAPPVPPVSAVVAGGAVASVVIPLHITVSLGAATAAPVQAAHAATGAGVVEPAGGVPGEPLLSLPSGRRLFSERTRLVPGRTKNSVDGEERLKNSVRVDGSTKNSPVMRTCGPTTNGAAAPCPRTTVRDFTTS